MRFDISVGGIKIETLSSLDECIKGVDGYETVDNGWCYAPRRKVVNLGGGEGLRPYPSRVFGLPKTHRISHSVCDGPAHIEYLIWILGFINGMQLTSTEAGFLDAAPVVAGKYHDIVWQGKSEEVVLAYAEKFWKNNIRSSVICNRLCAVIHNLFLSQRPQLLDFETFIHCYIALEGCFGIWCKLNNKSSRSFTHDKRIQEMCVAYKCVVPDWANPANNKVSKRRNDTLHDGLFFEAPLGYEIYDGNDRSAQDNRNELLEMQCLISRLICAILELPCNDYIESHVGTRMRYGVLVQSDGA
ncbi:MAG: hypothetical protein L3J02_06720 [Henriciella sp.]|nr:hypothetical protein [Henriciella sp.]